MNNAETRADSLVGWGLAFDVHDLPQPVDNFHKVALGRHDRAYVLASRIKPGRPQQNGRHERMHLTLKAEATRPAGINILQQQARFDDFVQEFNPASQHPSVYVVEEKRLC